jgi:glycosyltransferase involved in cell wall biosynthesis
MHDAADGGRLGEMRNRLVDESSGDVVVVADDDLKFHPDFYQGICDFGPEFDTLACRLLNLDGSRYWDWAVVNSSNGQHLLDYSEDSPHTYITGGLCVAKPSVLKAVRWDDVRGFYQQEDVDFSARLKAAGFRIRSNSRSTATHCDARYSQINDFVTQSYFPFPWQTLLQGLNVRGAYPVEGQFRWLAPVAEFRCAPVAVPTTISVTLRCPVSFADGAGPQRIIIQKGGQAIQHVQFESVSEEHEVQVQLNPGETGFDVVCGRYFLPPLTGNRRDRRVFSVQFSTVRVEPPLPAAAPDILNITRPVVVEHHLVGSFLLPSELSRALRSSLLAMNPSVASNISIEHLASDPETAKSVDLTIAQRIAECSIRVGNVGRRIAFVDETAFVGSGLLLPHTPDAPAGVVVGTAAAITCQVIQASIDNRCTIVTFSAADESVLLSRGVPRSNLQRIPVKPPRSLGEVARARSPQPERFIVYVYVPKNPIVEGDALRALLIELVSALPVGVVLRFEEKIASDEWLAALPPGLSTSTTTLTDLPDQHIGQLLSQVHGTILLHSTDEIGYSVRESLISGLPTVGLAVGAREELSERHGFFGIKSYQEIRSATEKMVRSYPSALANCIESIEQLGDAATFVEKLLAPAETKRAPGRVPGALARKSSITPRVTKIIDIDLRSIQFGDNAVRGIGHYTLHHIEALLELMPDTQFRLLTIPGLESAFLKKLEQHPNAEVSAIRKVRAKPDLHHICDPMSVMMGYDDPFLHVEREVATSTTFFDLIPLEKRSQHFDLYSPPQKVAYLNRLEDVANRANAILCISRSTATDLLKLHPNAQNRISVIYGGTNTIGQTKAPLETIKAKWGISKPYFLAVGGQDPHKGFQVSLSAFLRLSETTPVELVVAGSLNDPYKAYYKRHLEGLGRKDVIFTGFAEADELEALYANSLALLFPSEYEGFGLPVLEALARGCPVVTTRCSSLPEVGGDAALYIDVGDHNAMYQHLSTLLREPTLRAELSKRGSVQAQKFTWRSVAQATVEAWGKLLHHGRNAENPSRVLAANE